VELVPHHIYDELEEKESTYILKKGERDERKEKWTP
jgi:hypothetical protein